MHQSKLVRTVRTIAGWLVVGAFFFPIYFWTSVAFRDSKDIFNWPPIIFNFQPTMRNFEQVFGISFGFARQDAVAPGGPVAALVDLRERGLVDHLGVAGDRWPSCGATSVRASSRSC